MSNELDRLRDRLMAMAVVAMEKADAGLEIL